MYFCKLHHFSSRGSFIITQKENKGEYHGVSCDTNNCYGGSIDNTTTWYWDNNSTDTYAHVFDQNGKYGTSNNIPIRYANNSVSYMNTDNIPQCTNDYSVTHGKIEYTNTNISSQYSCNPNLTNPGLNAGNWYNFPTATAGSDTHLATSSNLINAPNSICPKGWQLPPNADTATEKKSYNNLTRNAYQIANGPSGSVDTNLLANSAMSFVRLGYYHYIYGSLDSRGDSGDYWSSTAYSATVSLYLYFHSGTLSPQSGYARAFGYSIRCVSR